MDNGWKMDYIMHRVYQTEAKHAFLHVYAPSGFNINQYQMVSEYDTTSNAGINLNFIPFKVQTMSYHLLSTIHTCPCFRV